MRGGALAVHQHEEYGNDGYYGEEEPDLSIQRVHESGACLEIHHYEAVYPSAHRVPSVWHAQCTVMNTLQALQMTPRIHLQAVPDNPSAETELKKIDGVDENLRR